MKKPNGDQKNNVSTLPIQLKYGDKIDLIRKLLHIYAHISGEKMTNRNVDLIALCMLYGVNSPGFRKRIAESNLLGFQNVQHVTTELSRLKKKGFIEDHPTIKKKMLSKGLAEFEELVNSGKTVGLYLKYERG